MDRKWPDSFPLELIFKNETRLSCFDVKTNCFILKILKKYFQLKMFFVKKKVMVIRKFWAKKIVGQKESLIKKISIEKEFMG